MTALRPAAGLAAILCGAVLLCAQAPMPALTPQQLATVVAASGKFKQLSQDVTVTSDGKSVSISSVQVQVLSAAFAHSAQLPVPYNATLEDIEITEAYTLKADGQKIPVDPSVILTQKPSTPDTLTPIYSDREQKLLIFPNVEPGDTLVFTSKTTQKTPLLPGQFVFSRYFNEALPLENASYSITAPAAMALNADSTWPRDTSRQGDMVTYRWRPAGALTPPPSPPPVFDPAKAPHLLVSSYKDFDAFAHDYAVMVRGKIAVTPAIQKQADAIASGLPDKRAQARAIYEWVSRNVRYVGIELGTGGLVPHDPDWTLNNRFGDCKDHAVLFASLLKARGIDAQLVLINASNHYKLGAIPTNSDFNHVIAWLPQLSLYADTTMAWVPFGQLPIADAGKPVLHVVETGTARHQTPVVPDGDLNTSYIVHAVMNEQGGMALDMTIRATGSWAASLRRADESLRALGPDLAAKRLLIQRNFPNATGTLLPGTGDDGSYQITGNARLGRPTPQANILNQTNALALMGLPGDGPMGPLNNRAITDADDTICFSAHQSAEISITFRPGGRPQAMPAELHLKTANLSYDTRWSADGDTFTLHRDFVSTMREPVCTAAIRHDTAEALAKIRTDYAVAIHPVAAATPAPPAGAQ